MDLFDIFDKIIKIFWSIVKNLFLFVVFYTIFVIYTILVWNEVDSYPIIKVIRDTIVTYNDLMIFTMVLVAPISLIINLMVYEHHVVSGSDRQHIAIKMAYSARILEYIAIILFIITTPFSLKLYGVQYIEVIATLVYTFASILLISWSIKKVSKNKRWY
ncbi:MAG: hypothetical protein ACOZCL_18060 [Bacillota bacterium]